MKWYDTKMLNSVPKWVHVIWIVTAVVILLCSIQQATHWFYGPSVTLFGNGVTFRYRVGDDWLATIGLLVLPFAWYAIWCVRGFGIGCVTLLIACGILMVARILATEVFDQTMSGGYSWDYTGNPGQGIAGFFSKDWILRLIADPAREIEHYLVLLGGLMLLLMIPIRDAHSRYRYVRVGQECSECGYSLKGTPSKVCPECGHQNPLYKQ